MELERWCTYSLRLLPGATRIAISGPIRTGWWMHHTSRCSKRDLWPSNACRPRRKQQRRTQPLSRPRQAGLPRKPEWRALRSTDRKTTAPPHRLRQTRAPTSFASLPPSFPRKAQIRVMIALRIGNATQALDRLLVAVSAERLQRGRDRGYCSKSLGVWTWVAPARPGASSSRSWRRAGQRAPACVAVVPNERPAPHCYPDRIPGRHDLICP
jgi:hypothetical protein